MAKTKKDAIGLYRAGKTSPLKVKYAVRSIFTSLLDDTIVMEDKIRRGTFRGLRDVPIIRRFVAKDPVGRRSKRTLKLLEMGAEFKALQKAVDNLSKDPHADPEALTEMENRMLKLGDAQEQMEEVERLYTDIRLEYGKKRPSMKKIGQLQNDMRRVADSFLRLRTEDSQSQAKGRAREALIKTRIDELTTDLKRKPGERDKDFRTRANEHQRKTRRAAENLRRMGLSEDEIESRINTKPKLTTAKNWYRGRKRRRGKVERMKARMVK